MSRVPLRYCEQMYEKVVRGGQSIAYGGCSVQIEEFRVSGKYWMYVITHYGTDICKIIPEKGTVEIMGGWSATDQSIINSFLYLFGMPEKCKRHDDVLTIIRP